jgi:phosphatidate cytidylyltransferase
MYLRGRSAPPYWYVLGYVYVLAVYVVTLAIVIYGANPLWFMIVVGTLLGVVQMSLVFEPKMTYAIGGKMFLSSLYIAMAWAALVFIKDQGIAVLFYLLLITLFTDMFAYFIGMRYGKHKMAPNVSPKKSWEGAVGGSFVAVIIATTQGLYTNVFDLSTNVRTLILLIVVSAIVSVCGQLGDLMFSKLKRDHNIKDFSNLMPGHGGILDRFDSTLFAGFALFIVLMVERLL